MAQILDGQLLANKFYEQFTCELEQFIDSTGIRPRLDVIMVGNNPASWLYVNNKKLVATDLGLISNIHLLDATAEEPELLGLIKQLNYNPEVNGILLQLPLPPHLDPWQILGNIDPVKDVDGLHPVNLGAFLHGQARLVPCTPLGCLQLIQSVQPNIKGANALVIGRSILVGKPLAVLLTQNHATVTLAHSQTNNLPFFCQQADIIIAAIGKPKFIPKEWLGAQSIVIDVGMTRMDDGRLLGDVDFSAACEHVLAISPVPGGVGPMTIANLMGNTLKAARLQQC